MGYGEQSSPPPDAMGTQPALERLPDFLSNPKESKPWPM